MLLEKPKRVKKNYFNQLTEDAIILYNNTSDPIIKSKIYEFGINWEINPNIEEGIHHAFFKLTQNIIHTFKFYHTEVDDLEHLQHEIIIFLLSKIHLFDKSKGAKAYSYFGTIVKRWLLLHNTKNYNTKVKKLDVDVLLDESYNYSYNMDDIEIKNNDLNKYIKLFIKHIDNHIFEIFPRKKDVQIADAILELFRNKEYIEIFNKKALYIYIREMIDVKTPKITQIANILNGIFKSQYYFYLENGWCRF